MNGQTFSSSHAKCTGVFYCQLIHKEQQPTMMSNNAAELWPKSDGNDVEKKKKIFTSSFHLQGYSAITEEMPSPSNNSAAAMLMHLDSSKLSVTLWTYGSSSVVLNDSLFFYGEENVFILKPLNVFSSVNLITVCLFRTALTFTSLISRSIDRRQVGKLNINCLVSCWGCILTLCSELIDKTI